MCSFGASLSAAQDRGAPQLDQVVRGLATTARVLVIGAHPDDEDTYTIAWLNRGQHVETAYLSLTRGDGGQNLIGSELGEPLGAIRTEELLAARRVDGGRQFFTRAYDFGFSKNAEETSKHWPRDSVLGDVVTVIRAFRPQVIYSIWYGTRADGHGHHEMAGLIAKEAFEAAADTIRFPARRHGEPWTPLKLYQRGDGVTIPMASYDAVLGSTYADIAVDSRSQHRSQGLADLALRVTSGGIVRGPQFGRLIRVATRVNSGVQPANEKSIFDGIDTSFARLVSAAPPSVQDDLRAAAIKADSATTALDYRQPSRVAPIVARMAAAIQRARIQMTRCYPRIRLESFRRSGVSMQPRCTSAELDLDASLETLERRAAHALIAAAELEVHAFAPRELLAFGDSMPVTVTVANHGRSPVTLAEMRLTGGARTGFSSVTIQPESTFTTQQSIIGYPDARPWWIGGRDGDVFPTRSSPSDGIARVSAAPDNIVPSVSLSEEQRRYSDVRLTLEIGGANVAVSAGEVEYRNADALLGIQDRPVSGVPSITLEFDRNLEWMPANKPIDRFLRLTVKSFTDAPRTVTLASLVPPGLKMDSLPAQLTIPARAQIELFLRVRGMVKPGKLEFGVAAKDANGTTFAEGFTPVTYPHIRPIYRYRTSAMWMMAVDIEVPSRLTVAYIQGAGDDNAFYLRQLGVPVTVIQPGEIAQWDLSKFSTVVVGTRAFEANRGLLAYAGRLMDFAKNGGTLVVQYGQNSASTPQAFPFPLEWQVPTAERVTEEDAPVTVLDPRSRLLSFPNRIGPDDWKGWVQERALYMPSKIDPKYETPLEMHDTGEKENRGAIAMTPLGKGMYVYTSLALFRQLPNAVPGGARLFVNLLSAGVTPATRPTP